MYVNVFEKAKGCGGTVPKFMQKQPSEGFFKRSVRRNLAEFTRKYLCRNLIFNNVKLCRSATSSEKRSLV